MTFRSFLRHLATAGLAIFLVAGLAGPAASDPPANPGSPRSGAQPGSGADGKGAGVVGLGAGADPGNGNPGNGNPGNGNNGNAGNPSAGNPNPGAGNPGDGNPGDGNSGIPNPGNGAPNPGNGNAGDPNPGNGNPNPGAGDPNPGNGNPGDPSPGNGNGNPGNGNGNPGNGNADPGNGNAGNANASGGPNIGTGDAGAGSGAQGTRGNNGTIKVVMEDRAQHPDNETRPCLYGIDFYGFDTGQVVDVIFSAQRPTGDRQELFRVENVVMGPRVNGSTPNRPTLVADGVNGTGDVPLATRLTQELTAPGTDFEYHPRHGWHVTVVVVDDNEIDAGKPDLRKSKVFWHNCPAVAPGGIPPRPGATSTVSGTVGTTREEIQGFSSRPQASPRSVEALEQLAVAVDVTPAQQPDSARPTGVKGVTFDRDELARAGTDPLPLLQFGAVLVVAGSGAMAAGRRRRRCDFISIRERLAGY